jgi:hypothetical protein
MTTMSARQLIIMAIIMVALMAVWLGLVFLADRQPRQPGRTPAGTSADGKAGAMPHEGTALVPAPRSPGDEVAVEQGPGHIVEEGEPKVVPRSEVASRM